MTSRERMRKLLAHQPVDRIPNGLGGSECTGLHILAYDKLKKILGVKDMKNRMYTFMANAIVEPSVLDVMDGDMIILASGICPSRFWGPENQMEWKKEIIWGKQFQVPKDWTFRHEADGICWYNDPGNYFWWGSTNWTCPPGAIYFDPFGLASSTSINLLNQQNKLTPDDYNPPHDIPEELLRRLEKSARWLYENTNYCIVCGQMTVDLQVKYGGEVAWWMRLVDNPETAHEFLHKACEAGLSQLKLLDQAIGKYADLLMIADDMGDKRGVTVGPDLWREIYKPHYKRFFTEWHKITRMKVSLHCCGSVSDILGDLIECGVDIYNPVQISAQRMEPEELKSQFGDKIVFYGGVFDAVQTPPSTPAEVVYETVKKNITTFSKGGNYIFAGEHNISGDTPKQHLEAILRAYNECRYSLVKSVEKESS